MALVLLMAGCEAEITERPGARSRPAMTPAPTTRESPEESPPRDTPRLILEATGRTRERLRVAISDLRSIGEWGELTDHLYAIELDSRSGSANAPEDGHLADAYFTGIVEDGGGGAVCDIMFFPAAVTADLVRWRSYYANGLTAEAPPTMRAFYGSLLAHELAHCRRGPRGEPVARSWEERVRRALTASGI